MRWLGALLPIAMSLVVVAAGVIHAIQVGGLTATQLQRDPAWARPFVAAQVILFVVIVGLVFALDL